MERIILDTDIGTDVDDVMAVSLAAVSPELKVEGITTVYGDVDLRARMVTKVLHMLGREDIPVMQALGTYCCATGKFGGWAMKARAFLPKPTGTLPMTAATP